MPTPYSTGRTYSIATLFLAMVISAVALASLRTVWLRVEASRAPLAGGNASAQAAANSVALTVAGGVAGFFFGAALAIWNSPASIHRLTQWLRLLGSAFCGCFLGAAAGARFTEPVAWHTLLLLPVAIIGGAALVAARRR